MYLLTGKSVFCFHLLGGLSVYAQNPQDRLFKKVHSSLLLTVEIVVGVKMVVISCSVGEHFRKRERNRSIGLLDSEISNQEAANCRTEK